MKKRYILLAIVALAGGYLYSGLPLPSSHTSDPRMAYVFAREGLGFASCVSYFEQTHEDLAIPLTADPEGAPGITVSQFVSDEVHEAGDMLANGQFAIVMPEISGIEVRDTFTEEFCASSVGPIVVVDDLALVQFHSPGGDIGVHVFSRGPLGWRAIERMHWGWW